MTEEHKALLETIAEELGGKLDFVIGCDKQHSWKKIEITYGHGKKERPVS